MTLIGSGLARSSIRSEAALAPTLIEQLIGNRANTGSMSLYSRSKCRLTRRPERARMHGRIGIEHRGRPAKGTELGAHLLAARPAAAREISWVAQHGEAIVLASDQRVGMKQLNLRRAARKASPE